MKTTFTLLVAVSLAGAASAQTKIEKPFHAELGLYIPTFSDGGKSLGGDVGVGYSFYRRERLDVAAVVRYGFFHGDVDGFGYDASLGTYGVDVRYRLKDSPLFVGVGLAAAQVHLGTDFGDGDTTKLGYSVEAGYDLSEKLYGLVRFQATTDDIRPYQGVTIGVGYRF